MVDVHELLRDGRTAVDRLDLQPALRKAAQQVEHDGVVPVPGVQQSLKQALVWCDRHILSHLLIQIVTEPRHAITG